MRTEKQCEHCSAPFTGRSDKRYCSGTCFKNAWRKANPEKIRTATSKYYAANQEKLLTNSAEWRKSNPEKARTAFAEWAKSNPEKVRAKSAKYYAANQDKVRARSAECVNILADSYIKHLLVQGTAISTKSVPQSLIDLKRVQVQITRKLKELNDAKSNDRD